ncbi:S8 family serine peptidase [Bacillus sp. AFS041924]|uniref:S8 family serine peptidase n=1 Tax=Bacillus sp. AFS041924 TaxID=2033503 RepID=UPI000BFCFB82|nr:S8 family serine peptidase [Bacillus sp. AFS041924]PGS50927.1 lactocepin precursor [Bacillus sp. AFS041924]
MNNKKNRKITTYALASALALSNLAFVSPTSAASYRPGDLASKLDQIRQSQESKELQNKNKVSDAKANLKASDKVRVIVEVDGQSPVEYATKQGKLFKDLSESQKSSLYAKVESQQNSVKSKLQSKGININYKKQFSTAFNGFSGVVEFGDVAKIEATSGVKSVYLAKEYNRPESEQVTPDMTKSHQFIQSKETWKDTGYDGKGMVISIIDTGIDPTHRDFKLTDPSKEDLTKDSVAQLVKDKGLQGKFYTDKVPYGYNYYDQNDIVTDLGPGASMHGMHVAGTTAANGDEANGGIKGVAPEAQVLAMKVFSNDPSYPSTWSDIYLAAIDDSIKLGADVLNMSLGSVASSYQPESAEDLAITRAVDNGIVCAVSSGNSNHIGYGWGDPLAQNPDIGVTGAPGLNKDTISVAASGNEAYLYEHAITVEGNNSLSVVGKGIDDWKKLSDKFGGNLPIVDLGKADNGSYKLGFPEDYNGVDVKGKIVLVARGSLAFADKTKYASQAGAAGIIVWNATNGVQYADQGGWEVPIMLVNSKADGEALSNAINGSGTLHVNQTARNESPEMGRMTSFTSWGVTPSLGLKPEITAPGGNILSTVNNNQYEVMSGTSMAAPHVAGGSALVQEYLKNDKRFSSLGVSERTHLAKVLLMNTSKVINDLDGHPFSPRRQGAGMMQIENAVTTPVYFYNKSTGEAKYELKDFQSKQVSMTFTAKNISTKDAFYKVDTTALTDEFYQTTGVDRNALQTGKLDGVKIDAPESVMVPAGQSVDFTVKIDLTNAKIPGFDKGGKEILADLHENIFVEGSVNLIGTLGNPNLTAPYVGFYGKWDSLPILDGFKDLGETRYFDLQTLYGPGAHDMARDGDNYFYGSVPGKNFYALSPNKDGYADDINALPSFLRNAEEAQYNILDKDGKFLRRLSAQADVTKNNFNNGRGAIMKDSASTIWDGKVNGEVVPDGLYNYEIKAVIGYDGAEWQSKKIPVYVDTHAPSIKATYDADKKVVTWEGSDDGTGVKTYGIFVNGKLVGQTDNTKSSFDLSTAPEKSVVEVLALDYAGNAAEDTAAIGDVDLPLVYITDGSKDDNGEYVPNSPEPWGAYSDNKVPVKGFVTDEIGIKTVKVNGKEVPVEFDAKTGHYNYSTTVTFDQDGPYTVQVEATDYANKSFSVARHVYVDTHAAEITTDAPARVDKNVDQVTFNVNLKDNYSYLNFFVGENHEFEVPLISPVDVVKPLNKDHKVTVPLKEGENKITLRATDLAGNETVKEVVINREDAPLTTGWVVNDDNKVYYYDEDGKMHKGFLELKQTEEDYTWVTTFYFDPSTGEMHTGWLDLNGKRYYFDQGGSMATDIAFVPENNTYFYFDSKGVAQSGIFDLFGDRAYFDAKSGLLRSAWKKVGSKTVYADKDGTLHIGWLNNSGKWYFFNKDGYMQTGWLNDGKDTYYLNSKGEKVFGWNTISGKTYYFNSTGVKAKAGWLKVSGKKFYLNSDGSRFSNGWKSISGKYYYFDKYGVMKTGWLTVSGKKYYLNSDGSRFSNGWKSISGKYYYFDKNGVVKTGWLTVSGKKYYLNGDGSRFNNGWKKISGKYYYFNKSGVMAVNTKIGKYKVGKDGARK